MTSVVMPKQRVSKVVNKTHQTRNKTRPPQVTPQTNPHTTTTVQANGINFVQVTNTSDHPNLTTIKTYQTIYHNIKYIQI